MRKLFVLVAVAAVSLVACAKQGPPGATRSEAAKLAGEWSVYTNDTKVNAWHAKLEARGAEVAASKLYDQDVNMGATQHKKGDVELWATFGVADGKVSGQLAGGAGKVEGTVASDGQGVSLHAGKNDWELRRGK